MREPIDQKSMLHWLRKAAHLIEHPMAEPIRRNALVRERGEGTREERAEIARSQQPKNWPNELPPAQLWQFSRSGRSHHQQAKKKPHPPSGRDSPSEGEKHRIGRVKQIGMENGEVLQADLSRDEIVDNAVKDRHSDAYQHDFQPLFHLVPRNLQTRPIRLSSSPQFRSPFSRLRLL